LGEDELVIVVGHEDEGVDAEALLSWESSGWTGASRADGKSRLDEEQIIGVLKAVESGGAVADV
jgi:hypothetical protein